MKHNIPNLSILFSVRVDSDVRLRNILATVTYYYNNIDCHILMLEADNESKLGNILSRSFPAINYVFIHDTNPIFHRTHYINEEFRLVKTRNAAVIDSDVIVHIKQLKEANTLLTDTSLVMVYPYDGRFINHSTLVSDKFRETIELNTFDNIEVSLGFTSFGGAFLVNVERYKELGWENEYFPGWGPEDFEREHRLEILGHKPARIMGKIHHLNHPRGINSSNLYAPLALTTKREYCKVCSMMPNELRQYISVWPWIVNYNASKRRPD